MFDRHTIGDVALAALLAMPTVALARPAPQPTDAAATTLVQKAALAQSMHADRGVTGRS